MSRSLFVVRLYAPRSVRLTAYQHRERRTDAGQVRHHLEIKRSDTVATVCRIVVTLGDYAYQQVNTVRHSPAELRRTSSYDSVVTQK